jgi:hypothetical protein
MSRGFFQTEHYVRPFSQFRHLYIGKINVMLRRNVAALHCGITTPAIQQT